jgi:hypothetical protein
MAMTMCRLPSTNLAMIMESSGNDFKYGPHFR